MQPGKTQNDRVFFFLPNYFTLDNAANAPRLSTGAKFKLTVRDVIDPMQFVWTGALAGFSQWNNSDPGYGQGAEGYAKRYGAQFADNTIEDFMTRAVFASAFHQDPRYYRLVKGSFLHRTGYALSRLAVTRSDSGKNQPNYSEILGSAVAAGISTYTYHPAGDRTISNALSTWGAQVGYDAISKMLWEFWPDIRHKIHKSNPTPVTSVNGAVKN